MYRKALLFVFFLAFTAGCATQTRVDIAPVPVPYTGGNKDLVAFVPFGGPALKDYQTWLQVNTSFYEAFKRNFLVSCLMSVPLEEVMGTLEEKGLIKKPAAQPIKLSPTLLALYEENWSAPMREEIDAIVQGEIRRQRLQRPVVLRLNLKKKDLINLGRAVGARYVLWGRVDELRLRQEDTLNPFKIGFLTAQNRILSRLVYGAPESSGYGVAQEVSVGGILAGIIGSEAKDPFEPPHKKTIHVGHPLFGQTFTKHSGGTEDYDLGNALFWGGAGMMVSFLAAHGGDSPEAVVGVSVYLYDVKQEKIIWENRIRLRVSPQSFWAPRHPEDLLLQAVEEAARRLSIQLSADLGIPRVAYLVSHERPGAKKEKSSP